MRLEDNKQCQAAHIDRGMQTDWSCEPWSNCLVATTAEQALRLAGWWNSACQADNYNRLGAAAIMCSEECNSSDEYLEDDCFALAGIEDVQEMLLEVKLPPEPAEILGFEVVSSEFCETLWQSSALQIKAAKNKEKRRRKSLQKLARTVVLSLSHTPRIFSSCISALLNHRGLPVRFLPPVRAA